MASEYEIFEFLEADSALSTQRRQRRRVMREESDPFELDEGEFIRRYRLSKNLARILIEELRPMLKTPVRITDLSVETKVLTALSFYATGSYQRPIGNIEGQLMAQPTVSTVISQITACLNSNVMRRKYIAFPASDQNRHRIKAEFYNKFNIPGVLGCIDCTHVAIVRPSTNEERYYGRKQYHSLNVQLVCDANMQILSVDASHGGASHDSFIWTNHPLRAHLEDLSNTENTWFLGDSGYPLRKTMMTPVLNAAPNTPEAYYTTLHVRARCIIERTIGLLKARFRCLLVHRVLHYSPEVAGSIVNACVILHNMCNTSNIPVEPLSSEEIARESQLQFNDADEQPLRNNRDLQQGWAMRNSLIHQLWERRHSGS